MGVQVPLSEKAFSVSHYSKEGAWDWDRLNHFLPDGVRQQLAVDLDSSGQFTLKLAYQLVWEASVVLAEKDPFFQNLAVEGA